jgi:pimeloyl-ACP methyl ester carboxylesterase
MAPWPTSGAAHGFVVIQLTHLDSTALGLREADYPEAPLHWRSRPADISYVLDHLDDLEAAFPQLRGRIDRDKIAVVGHSLGGHTVSLLLGARTNDPSDGSTVEAADPRIKAGVMLAAPGTGEGLAEFAATHYPVMEHTDFTTMIGPALTIAGDKDINWMFSDRLSYRWDTYTHSPGRATLPTVFGREHMLGGISGYAAAETTDEDPERVAFVRALAWAYLRSNLYPGDTSWDEAVAAIEEAVEPLGKVESK